MCCMAMYGEIAELYKQGHMEVPEGVIKVWADNGYGKMVSRRHGNLNYRVPALPETQDGDKNGVYYHVTFHDLQASNHLTQLPSSASLIVEELTTAFTSGADEYLLVNSGNILPHVYTLDLVANLWMKGEVDAEEQLTDFIGRLYSSQLQEISQLYRDYSRCTIVYGPHKDDRAGRNSITIQLGKLWGIGYKAKKAVMNGCTGLLEKGLFLNKFAGSRKKPSRQFPTGLNCESGVYES